MYDLKNKINNCMILIISLFYEIEADASVE